jgi:hypothetical protein
MNAQEVFDKVATHLLTQARPAFDITAGCLYRANDGTSCAVGCLIPDHLYDKKFETLTARTLIFGDRVNEVAPVASAELIDLLEPHAELLERLQDDHDVAADGVSVSLWPSRLRMTAVYFDLDASAVDALEPSFRQKIASV